MFSLAQYRFDAVRTAWNRASELDVKPCDDAYANPTYETGAAQF